jgi:cardiolipin synthase
MEAMLAAIAEAKSSVRLEMYIFTASPIGERFREALEQAARRGAKVRVLLDSWGSLPLSDSFWDGLREAGGQMRWFNPIELRRWGIRDHRKLLVCDESVAFVGGFNIAPEYQGDGVKQGWYDLGLEVEGYLAGELAISFDRLYALADFKHKRFTRFRHAVNQKLVTTPLGQIVEVGPGHHRDSYKALLVKDISSASSLRIIAAYFLPPRRVRRALISAARRGTRVQLILAAKSDVPLLMMAVRRFYQVFLRAGIELYEYQPQILHGKLIIADGVVYVGSANLDQRTFLSNYELVLRVTNPDLAAQARDIFSDALEHCQRIEPRQWRRSRNFWNKLCERWAFFLLGRLDVVLSRRQVRNLR